MKSILTELALIVSCRVHQSDVDLDNVVVDAPEEEVEEEVIIQGADWESVNYVVK